MNSFKTRLPASLSIGILLIIALFSCKKDPYEIGIDLLPPSDTLNVRSTDTCTIQAFSMLQDSIRTDKPGSLLMGSMMDPVFGLTTSSFYSQVHLSSGGADFGNHPVLDSIVLMLFYGNYYGDTLTRQNVKVYEISEDLSYDSVHYSNQKLETYPTLLADQDFTPRTKDSVSEFKTKLPPHLRINLNKLTNYLGNKILYAPASSLQDNASFIKFMKGLYVSASPVSNHGAIMNFSIANGLSRLAVYFHNGDDPLNDSLQYNMFINSSCARFLHIDHNKYLNASQNLKRQILNHDSAQGASQLFLQGLGGVKIKVKFPFMKNFGKGKVVAINDALLEFKNMDIDTTYAPPPVLTMIRQDSAGRIGYLVDNNETSGYWGGTYNKAKKSYFFRLTQHMQNVLQNAYTTHFDLYILVNSPIVSAPSPYRVVLNGTKPVIAGDNGSRMRLNVTYTVLN